MSSGDSDDEFKLEEEDNEQLLQEEEEEDNCSTIEKRRGLVTEREIVELLEPFQKESTNSNSILTDANQKKDKIQSFSQEQKNQIDRQATIHIQLLLQQLAISNEIVDGQYSSLVSIKLLVRTSFISFSFLPFPLSISFPFLFFSSF